MEARWEPDVLGDGYEATVLDLGHDEEGPLHATLVRYTPPRTPRVLIRRAAAALLRRAPGQDVLPLADADVLYVHGWNDYFFQTHVAEAFARLGARFFALDLRKYGRSLRPDQTAGFVTDLAECDQEIEMALGLMETATRGRRLILMGHSTGGLILSLWAHRHRGRADALILNSPWLEFQAAATGRKILAPLVEVRARRDPRAPVTSIVLGNYATSISAERRGEWTYNTEWKRDRPAEPRAGWLAAIFAGQARIEDGIDVGCPVLSMMSSASTLRSRWTEAMMRTDCVLEVNHIARASLKLGPAVTVVRLEGAIHDVFLSAAPVRQEAERQMVRWLCGYGRMPGSAARRAAPASPVTDIAPAGGSPEADGVASGNRGSSSPAGTDRTGRIDRTGRTGRGPGNTADADA